MSNVNRCLIMFLGAGISINLTNCARACDRGDYGVAAIVAALLAVQLVATFGALRKTGLI